MDSKKPSDIFPSRPKIVFMGTPDFAVPTLKTLIKEGYDIPSVVTQPDRPKGRGQKITPPPVKLLASENSLPIIQPEKLDTIFLDYLLSLKPGLLVVIAFGQIIPGNVLRAAKWGSINIHGSLLPKYRGSAPIQWAVINNEKTTGLTTMFMDEGLDTGPILLQREVEILEGETAGQLHDRLANVAPELLIKTIEGLSKNMIKEKVQDNALATFAPKLRKEQGLISWSWDAERICGLIRGLDPWPGAFTYYNGKMIKLFGCSVCEKRQKSLVPGRIKGLIETGLEIETGEGFLSVEKIQMPGKKRTTAKEFLMGSHLPSESILGK